MVKFNNLFTFEKKKGKQENYKMCFALSNKKHFRL